MSGRLTKEQATLFGNDIGQALERLGDDVGDLDKLALIISSAYGYARTIHMGPRDFKDVVLRVIDGVDKHAPTPVIQIPRMGFSRN